METLTNQTYWLGPKYLMLPTRELPWKWGIEVKGHYDKKTLTE